SMSPTSRSYSAAEPSPQCTAFGRVIAAQSSTHFSKRVGILTPYPSPARKVNELRRAFVQERRHGAVERVRRFEIRQVPRPGNDDRAAARRLPGHVTRHVGRRQQIFLPGDAEDGAADAREE